MIKLKEASNSAKMVLWERLRSGKCRDSGSIREGGVLCVETGPLLIMYC